LVLRQNNQSTFNKHTQAASFSPCSPHSTAAAKERLHKSLALPTSYADVKPALNEAPSKESDEGKQQ
jgi:hypothetical protein